MSFSERAVLVAMSVNPGRDNPTDIEIVRVSCAAGVSLLQEFSSRDAEIRAAAEMSEDAMYANLLIKVKLSVLFYGWRGRHPLQKWLAGGVSPPRAIKGLLIVSNEWFADYQPPPIISPPVPAPLSFCQIG